LRSHEFIGIMHVRPFNLIFFWWPTFRFNMCKEDWKTSNHFHSFNTQIIKHYNLSIRKRHCYVFFSNVISNMFSLILYSYNSKRIDTTYQNVDFLFNLEQIPRSLGNSTVILGLIACEVLSLNFSRYRTHWWGCFKCHVSKHVHPYWQEVFQLTIPIQF